MPSSESLRRVGLDAGLLLLRVGTGSMMLFGHGLAKALRLFGPDPIQFADPIGLGVTVSLALAVLGEAVGSTLVALGLLTRLAAVPLLVTMLVAALVVHVDDPWAKKELALLYAVPALTLILTGPGRFSIDAWLARRAAAAK